ncbi:MAG: alkaline phosphatase, partial [Bacteroidales bacterium]|nr:alkaline phosphatase [Bacteroidales bacterium]
MGGGKKYFCERKDGENLLDQMFDKGWNIYESLDAVQDKEGRTFVVADRKHLPEACKRGDFLPKATAKAIDLLDNEKGFFLMIEGSQIDFACHDNDSATMVDEMRDFNDMLNVVLDFAKKDQNTLVVVTADHETGGLSIIDPHGRYTNPAFHFSTGSHSEVFVPVFSYGPGADRFTGLMDNTDIFKRLMGLYK